MVQIAPTECKLSLMGVEVQSTGCKLPLARDRSTPNVLVLVSPRAFTATSHRLRSPPAAQ